MLLQGKILRNLFIGMVLLNALLIGGFFYLSAKQPSLPSALFPGKFGPGIDLQYTGNMVVLALLLLINALAITIVGFKDCLHAMWAGMRLSPKMMRNFLHEKAGLASDISGVVAAAVQEEEKLELSYIDRASWVLRVGLILFTISMPLLSIALARAEAAGVPMFAENMTPLPNNTVSNEEIWRFTGDQVAGALLLDIPEVFHLRVSAMEANTQNFLFPLLIVIYRTVLGFGVLLAAIAAARMRALWRYAMEVAMPVTDIVAMEPALAAGPEHDDYRHGHHGPEDHGHGHDDHGHGHDNHGHENHGHDDHGHDDHGHSDHGHEHHEDSHDSHDDHGHGDDHGHSDNGHGHDDHGHDNHGHGHDDHGHDDHGHGHDDHSHGHDDHGHDDHHSRHHHDGRHREKEHA
ncbi:MAG TPA: hypothetical protein VHL34_21760 [Rhizomicrobium sp.]|nr:hypothetical protein [Rhizomicrobium sp.]